MGVWNYHLIFIEHPSDFKVPEPPEELKQYVVKYVGANALHGVAILPTGSKEGWHLHELQHEYVKKVHQELQRARWYRIFEVDWGDLPHPILNLKNAIKLGDRIFAWECKF